MSGSSTFLVLDELATVLKSLPTRETENGPSASMKGYREPSKELDSPIGLGGIRSNSFSNLSCIMTFRSHIPEIITPQGGFMRPFRNYENGKVIMDVKNKQQAVIEFFIFEGCAGETSVMSLRNEERPGRRDRHETDAAIRSILQEDPNASLRNIAEALPISPEAVRTHLSRISYTLKT
jgi:hypothetical protein